MFWFLLVIAITIWLSLLTWNGRKLRKAAKQFTSDIPALPVIGHAHHFVGSAEVLEAAFKKFGREAIKQGDIIPIWLVNHLYIMISDPKTAELILRVCLEKDQNSMRFIRIFTGDGLIFAPVNIWRPRRKVAIAMFNQKYLNSFVQVFARQSVVMVEQLQPMANGREFSIWKYVTTNTFDSVCETNFSIEMNSQKMNGHPFLDAFEGANRLCGKRMVQPWIYSDFVYRLLPESKRFDAYVQYMHKFLDKIVQDKHQALTQRNENNTQTIIDNGKMISFLDMLIEKSNGYNDLELRDELMIIIIAGTDTSAVTASFAFILLSRLTEEQEKVYAEIREVFGDSDRLVEKEDLPKLKYLELFIKETLRLYPPAPIIVREVDEEVKLPSGKTLVPGTGIIVNIGTIHRNPHYWGEDADQFRPERFLTPLQHPAQFIPFSHGMRNCIGYQYAMMSIKTTIATLLRRYRVLPPAGLTPEELRAPLRVKQEVFLKHADNFVLRLEPRH